MKILSIVMPCYNVELYLNKGLKSLADVIMKDELDVIIVNDGSTDGTLEIAKKYVKLYPNVFTIIDKSNGGHGSGINIGIKYATGLYFRILDGDDWIDTAAMDEFIKSLHLYINIDMFLNPYCTVDMHTLALKDFPIPMEVKKYTCMSIKDLVSDIDKFNLFTLPAITIKTKLLQESQITLPEHTFYVDYEYIVKITSLVKNICITDDYVYRYLIGNTNQSINYMSMVERFGDHEKVALNVLEYISNGNYLPPMKAYMYKKATNIIFATYNISLIFDTNRKKGENNAKLFRSKIRQKYLIFYLITSFRYILLRILHLIGVDYAKFEKIKKFVRGK